MFMLHGNGWTCGRGRCWWTFWCTSRCYQLLGAEHPLIRRQCVSNGRRRHESRWRNGPVPLAATVPRREQDRDDPRAHCDSDEHHPGQTPPVTGGDGDRAGDDHPKAGARADRRPGEVTAPWVRAPRDEFSVGGNARPAATDTSTPIAQRGCVGRARDHPHPGGPQHRRETDSCFRAAPAAHPDTPKLGLALNQVSPVRACRGWGAACSSILGIGAVIAVSSTSDPNWFNNIALTAGVTR